VSVTVICLPQFAPPAKSVGDTAATKSESENSNPHALGTPFGLKNDAEKGIDCGTMSQSIKEPTCAGRGSGNQGNSSRRGGESGEGGNGSEFHLREIGRLRNLLATHAQYPNPYIRMSAELGASERNGAA
jgi:hypothetical protein